MSIIRFLPMLIVMGTIFFLSHNPGDNFPSLAIGMDKLAHALAYAALAASTLYALCPWTRDKSISKVGIAVLAFSFFYGLSDEFHQSFIPNRSPDWRDILADTCGAGMVVFVWARWRTKMIHHPKKQF